ncbi:MAG: rhodanese-like domain-containing protein [Paludibacteraceae bacterium]|nr:rhodanese-like domain-containing protein [Paludibacteraceae bacterium]MBR6043468.1 rhodanese-like domain-containing protein [Paludibacteraceae bacterium]
MKKTFSILLTLLLGVASANAQKNYRDLDVKGFEELIATDTIVLVDCRTVNEYKDGHIKGAVLLDFKDPNHVAKAMDLLNKEKHVAIYCRSGRRSSAFAFQLANQGYKVTNLYGGILMWQANGKEIER